MMNMDSSAASPLESVKQLMPSESVLHVLRFAKPGEYLTMNQRKHWTWTSKQKRAWREAAYWAACEWRSKPTSRRLSNLAIVTCIFPMATNRRRDPHNYYPTMKPIIDGLTDAGLWPDDTPEYLRTIEPTFTRGQGKITLVIGELWPGSE